MPFCLLSKINKENRTVSRELIDIKYEIHSIVHLVSLAAATCLQLKEARQYGRQQTPQAAIQALKV